ncbi:MAG: macro domain-containing protein [Cytophagales bacterium]|nr:macro domain-containing protein [Cytophaga sp.]
MAIDYGCTTISFPNISTGAYRFPKEEAARIAIDTVIAFLQEHDAIDKVLFICYETDNFQYMKKHLDFITSHKIKI